MLHKIGKTKGFSLIEMAIVLLIAGLLVGGAFQLMNNLQQQRTDQATANEMRQITTALQQFLLDQSGVIVRDISAVRNPGGRILLSSGSANIDPDGTGSQRAQGYFENNYLNVPSGEPLGSPLRLLSRGYTIGIRNVGDVGGRTVLKGVVLRTPTSDMNESRLARVAGLVGSQGGLVRTAGAGVEVVGVQGSWQVAPSQYALIGADAPKAGQLAAFTTTIDNQMNTNVISRINTGNPEANTMRTDLALANSNMVQSALGYGYTKMRMRLGDSCDSGIPAIALRQADGTAFAPPKTFPESGANLSSADQLRLQGLVVSGYADSGYVQETLLQCRKTGSNWVWQLAIPAQTGSYYIYAAVPNTSSTPNFNGYGAAVLGSTAGAYNTSPPNHDTLFHFNGNNKPTGVVNAVSSTNTRIANTWFWNNTGGPMQLLISLNDGADVSSAIFIRENYSATTAGSLKNLIHATVTSDWEGDTPMTVTIPSDAIYAVVIEQASRANRLTIWAEYR